MQQSRTHFASFTRCAVGAMAAVALFSTFARDVQASQPMPAPRPVVENVDLSRFAGKWFEILAPKWSASGACNDAMDVYEANPNAASAEASVTLKATHSCTRFGLLIHRADGYLYAPNSAEPGRLVLESERTLGSSKLNHYDIIEMDENYQWAVISDDFRQYSWVLSRTPELDEATLGLIRMRLCAAGNCQAFKSNLRCVPQSTATTRACQTFMGR